MQTTTVYKCDICGTEYNSQEACEKCESIHKGEYSNAKCDKYSRMRSYPDSITVHFDKDSENKFVVYSYSHQYMYKNHKDPDTDVEIDKEIDNE